MSTRAAAPSPTSNTEPLPEDPAARAAEIARRRTLLARAEAPASVEGGRIGPTARAPWERWAAGEIAVGTLVATARALHGPG